MSAGGRDAACPPPTAAQCAAFARRHGIEADAARRELEAMRARQIAARRRDPYANGYEPPIWFAAKALLRNPAWSAWERGVIARRLGAGVTAEAFAARMRRALGFAHPVTKLLVMGSNRSGKTDFAAKLCLQTAMQGERRVCSGAQTLKTQKRNQMGRVWHYLPEELKARNLAGRKATDPKENINWSEKNGFAGSRIIFGNGSKFDFVTYEQNVTALEGVEYDLVHLDEEYPMEFHNLMTTRITSRAGTFLGTFTPLSGYTSAVAAFLSDAEVVRRHVAYLRPRDGGEKEPWSELGLGRGEWERLAAWRAQGAEGDCGIPESRPEDCFGWLYDAGAAGDAFVRGDGRVFDCVPRVCRCQGGQAAAVWFYGSDNPYGLPGELIQEKLAHRDSEAKIYAAVYGMARELKGRLFGKAFDRRRNTCRAEEVPGRLVRFMVIDPAAERNWCMGWYGLEPATGVLYKYREWPGPYEVPGEGVPGPWAVPSDRNNGRNDGARGEGQESFGWGYEQYAAEVRRLEGGERMAFRLIDARAAGQARVSAAKSETLFEALEAHFDGLAVADGQRTEVGYSRMMDRMTAGRYVVSEACANTLACYDLLTGADGLKGAAKDMIDCDRYANMSDIWDYTAADAEEADGGAGEAAADGSGEGPGRFARRRAGRYRPWW